MSVATPRRTAPERAMLEHLRADAWRWDEPAERERVFLEMIRVPGRFDAIELNVLYEMLMLGSVVEALTERGEEGMALLRDNMGSPTGGPDASQYHVPSLPFNLMITVAAVLDDPNLVEADEPGWVGDPRRAPVTPYDQPASQRAVGHWRQATAAMRRSWRAWSHPTALYEIFESSFARVSADKADIADLARPAMNMACESLLRISWLFECEERDGITFGPVSERRLPRDPAEAAITLRRFVEQQPELRKVPAFIHVAPRDAAEWMRPKDYARCVMPHADPDQVRQIASDALRNRHYIHDHVAVIEVDRKPVKMLVLAPEVYDRATSVIYLDALVVHERGSFACEVMVNARVPEAPTYGYGLPFGGYAWRSLGADEAREALRHGGRLPPDQHVVALVIAAWRDLVVARVREEQYESEVTRGCDQKKDDKRAERKARKAQTKVIRYLPRTVVVRRAEAAERAANPGGPKRALSRPFRVGAFARTLAPGWKRSEEAQDFAEEIGMPLLDTQTVVRPHIRGGTDEEREAMLAQDDVRLWRSWAAVDVLYARATPSAVE